MAGLREFLMFIATSALLAVVIAYFAVVGLANERKSRTEEGRMNTTEPQQSCE
jgi:hypothetical protein